MLTFWLEQLARPGAAGWSLYYAVAVDYPSPILIASISYKGPPADGVVEIGYSVVPSWQRRGVATDASGALLDMGFRLVAASRSGGPARSQKHGEPRLGENFEALASG